MDQSQRTYTLFTGRNGDGKPTSTALFDRFDGNKDDFVTEAELVVLWKR